MLDYFLSPSFKSHLENLYYLAGVVLAGGIVIGIWQLRQQKNLSKVANRREAYRIAAERCEYFGRVVLPEQIELKKLFKAEGVCLLDKCKIEITDKGFRAVCYDGKERTFKPGK